MEGPTEPRPLGLESGPQLGLGYSTLEQGKRGREEREGGEGGRGREEREVCVCVREREREREAGIKTLLKKKSSYVHVQIQ